MCRLLLADAGVCYEDVRYTSEDWPKHKPGMIKKLIIIEGP